jgi:hypothetical protein
MDPKRRSWICDYCNLLVGEPEALLHRLVAIHNCCQN